MKKTITVLFFIFLLFVLTGCNDKTNKKDKYEWPFADIPVAEKYVNDIQEVATGKFATINEFTKKSFFIYVAKLEREGFQCVEEYSDSNTKLIENLFDEKIENKGFVTWRGSNGKKVVELHWYDITKYNELSDSDITYNLKVKVWNEN